MVRAGDMCPAPPKRRAVHTAPVPAAGDHLIRIESDSAYVDAAGLAELTGHVQLHQDRRSVSADEVTYDEKTGKVTVKGSVDFEDPKVGVRSESGRYDVLGGADFNTANFRIFERNGRGFAKEIAVHPDGKIEFAKVRYTTCPVGNQDWMLQASSISLDTEAQKGIGRGVLLRFKGVPIFYSPVFAFPLGDERKSGFLFPSIGHSTNNGYQFEVPYYFNLAPNYDLTLTPGYLSARGVDLGGEFRYLSQSSHGQIETNFLPNDAILHTDRAYLHYNDVTDLSRSMRFDADIASVSDSNYFSDFGAGADQTSVTFLARQTDLLYYDDAWRVRAQLQNFQTIDTSLEAGERPYSRVPRVEAYGALAAHEQPLRVRAQLRGHQFPARGGSSRRAHGRLARAELVEPYCRIFLRSPPSAIITPSTICRMPHSARPTTPTRSLPYGRLDTGLIFERDAGSSGQRTETLEPRMVYSYVPYRNQNELPVFDTAEPDFNMVELFRTNRYRRRRPHRRRQSARPRADTRLFNQTTGNQYLSATVGQIRYFSAPRVWLPNEITQTLPGQTLNLPPGQQAVYIQPGQTLPTLPGQTVSSVPGVTPSTYNASDIISEVSLTAYKNWSVISTTSGTPTPRKPTSPSSCCSTVLSRTRW